MHSTSLTRHRDPKAKKEVKLKKLEESWSIPVCTGIPTYSTESDKYCPLGITRQFNESQKNKVKTSKASEEETAHWIKSNISNKFEQVPDKFTADTVLRAELPPNPSDIPDASILHKVIVRENLVTEIKKLIQHQSDADAARSEVSELVKAIRFESIDIVEDIAQWKKSQAFSREFLYRGVNYMVKMYSDLNFLDEYDEFNFGFPITNNPFVFPYNGGKQLPENLRFTSSTIDGNSGFVARKTRMEDEILVDGIEVSRLQMCDNIIRDEVEYRKKNKSTSKHRHDHQMPENYLSANSHGVLAVGENGMNDSYMSAVPRNAHGHSVSFRNPSGEDQESASASYGGNQLRPLQQSYLEGASPSPMWPIGGEPSFASYGERESAQLPAIEDSLRSGHSVSQGKQPSNKGSKKIRSVTIETKASPPKVSKHSVPTKKWLAKNNQIKQMKERAGVLEEEIGVVKAMHAHVSDQVEFKVTEHQRLAEVRDGLESKRKLAINQDRLTKAQDYAVKVNVADMELQKIHFTVKDLQRQRFFFEQEVKRKKQTVKRLLKDIEDVSKQIILQKKLEKRAKSEGLLAVLKSRNRGESLDEDESSDTEFNGRITYPLATSDEESATDEPADDSVAFDSSMAMRHWQISISRSEDDNKGVSDVLSSFSTNVGPTIATENPKIDKDETEELLITKNSNITYLDGDEADTDKLDSSLVVSIDDEAKEIPVAAGSGFTFAKQSSSIAAKDKAAAVNHSLSDSPVEVDITQSAKKEDEEVVLKDQTCIINNDVIRVKIFSTLTTGVTTLRAYDDRGETTLTYQLIPALASQLKELSDAETNTFISEMLNSTLVVPSSDNNMGTEHGVEVRQIDAWKEDTELDVSSSAKSVLSPDNLYEISVKDVTYSSKLEFKEEGAVEIHAFDMKSGKKQIIPLLPVLAKQIKSLTYDQVKGVISDIIKTFTNN